MAEFDRYILARLERLKTAVRSAYEAFDFQTAYHSIVNFIVVDLSALYIDVVRDRLYCERAASPERRSAQTALYRIVDTLTRMLAPLIPYTADEIHGHIPGASAASVHLLELQPADPAFADPSIEASIENRWARLLSMREEALKLLETMRQTGAIGAPLEASVRVGDAGGVMAASLKGAGTSLADLLIVSDAHMMDPAEAARFAAAANGDGNFVHDGWFGRVSPDKSIVVAGRRAAGLKCQRCWKYYDDGGDPELDPRCRQVVRA
jgi:isoleucyl-tRNA synthetase